MKYRLESTWLIPVNLHTTLADLSDQNGKARFMLGDIFNFLKFLTDPSTRDTIRAFTEVASRRQKNWKQHIHTLSGRFTIAEWPKINAFTNDLFQRIAEVGLSSSKMKRFQTVYSELIDNAYYHGCNKRNKCKVTVKCVYSKWFIQLEVSDTGKGFNYDQAISKIHNESREGQRTGKSGLEIVSEIADSIQVHKSRVMVVIAGEDRIRVRTNIEKIGQKDLLTIFTETDDDWSFLSPDWTPFREALQGAKQELVLIRFGKATEKPDKLIPDKSRYILVPESLDDFKDDDHLIRETRPRRFVKKIITETANENRYYAYVVPTHWVYDDMKDLQVENLQLFQDEAEARLWLKKHSKKS